MTGLAQSSASRELPPSLGVEPATSSAGSAAPTGERSQGPVTLDPPSRVTGPATGGVS